MIKSTNQGRPTGSRIALVGFGTLNQLILREALTLGHTVVGVIGRGTMAGKDAGSMAGLGELGIPVSTNIAEMLRESRPDVVLMATASTLQATLEDVESCLNAGVPVITAAEEYLAPWASDPDLAQRIDTCARANNTTVFASGHIDILWVHLPMVMSGITHQLSALTGTCTRPFIIDRSSNAKIAALLGQPTSSFPVETTTELIPGAAFSTAHALVSGMGLQATGTATMLTADTHDLDLTVLSLDGRRTIPAGTVSGTRRTVTVSTSEGTAVSITDIARVGATSSETWQIEGQPSLEITVSTGQGLLSTATQMLGRIAQAQTAPPGLVALTDLPPLRFDGEKYS